MLRIRVTIDQVAMAGRVQIVCLLIVCVSWCLADEDKPQPVVETKFGKVLGKTITVGVDDYIKKAKTVDVFQSIPYAESPVGSLRFESPAPKSWDVNAVFDATGPQTACMQDLFEVLPIGEAQSEDCLHLDVYTPNPRPKKAAVMVFIHGGGFSMGIGTSRNMSQAPMVAIGNVVAVNVNYRLNVFGFLSTGDDVVSGNMGLKDQALALQWVHDNIAAFGGDPDKVTIYGESAGSISVAYHVVSPMSKGLFHRAIMQSGTMMDTLKTGKNHKKIEQSRAFAFGKTLGCNQTNVEELVGCLRSIDSGTLLANCSMNTAIELGESPFAAIFLPNYDGEFMPDDPGTRFDDTSTINDVDVMLGSLADEGSFFVNLLMQGAKGLLNRTAFDSVFDMGGWLIDKSELARETIKLMYLSDELISHPESDHSHSLSRMLGDVLFVCPTEKTAQQLAAAGRENVYLYHMTHVPSRSIWNTTGLGAAHGEDLVYVFGMHYNDENHWFYGKLPDEEVRLTHAIMTYWSNFAKTGDPNNSGSDNDFIWSYPEWPIFSLPGRDYKEISTSMRNDNSLKPKDCTLINDLLPKLKETEDKAKNSEVEHEKSKYTGTCQSDSCDGEEP